LIAKLAGVAPFDAWRALSGLIAPLSVLGAAAFGFLVGGPAAAGVGAWALLFTYGGSLATGFLREAVLATKLADQLALAAATAVIADLARGAPGDPPRPRVPPGVPAPVGPSRFRGTRRAAVGLALGAVACHVFSALQFALAFTALGLGLVIRDRGFSRPVRRLAVTGALIAVACLPYLLWRAGTAYAPANPLHTEPQGLLTLWDGVRVVRSGVLWDWMGKSWVLFPLAWWALWRHGRWNPAVLYLLTTSLAVALVIFDPPVVKLLQPRLGSLRMVGMVPLAGLLAWLVPGLLRRAARGARRSRTVAGLGLAVMALLLAPVALDALFVLLRPSRIAAAEAGRSPARWRSSLEWLDRVPPAGQVVLSDPGTSYAVPMFTRHFVVTLLDQHSSPNDARAVERILDARDALDPWGPWERARDVVARYRVTLVVLNGRFVEIPPFDYWAPSPGWFQAERARLDGEPGAFERLADEGDFVVYRVHAAALAIPPTPRSRAASGSISPRSRASDSRPASRARATRCAVWQSGGRLSRCGAAPTGWRCGSTARCPEGSPRPGPCPSRRASCSSSSRARAIASAPIICPPRASTASICGGRAKWSGTASSWRSRTMPPTAPTG